MALCKQSHGSKPRCATWVKVCTKLRLHAPLIHTSTGIRHSNLPGSTGTSHLSSFPLVSLESSTPDQLQRMQGLVLEGSLWYHWIHIPGITERVHFTIVWQLILTHHSLSRDRVHMAKPYTLDELWECTLKASTSAETFNFDITQNTVATDSSYDYAEFHCRSSDGSVSNRPLTGDKGNDN